MSRSFRERKSERGVTMVLIAIALVALLAMAALAIDITTLYVARGEAQRAANAAALAGAKMFATSGFTSGFLGSPSSSATQTEVCVTSGAGASGAANRQAEAVAAQNQVVGQPGAVQFINCDFAQPGNPRMTVTVQRVNLPTFFARIWGGSANSVSASATAEAYNPSGLTTPIQLENIKPWLVPNCDPTSTGAPSNPNCPLSGADYSYFVDPADGSITNGGSFIGKTIIFDRLRDTGNPADSNPKPPNSLEARFYAMDPIDPPAAAVCPSTSAVSCDQVGADRFRDNIACASKYQFSCGQDVGDGQFVEVRVATGYGEMTREGAQCLIHADGLGLGEGQDIFSTPNGPGTPPVVITGGDNNPNTALRGVVNISRSDSIITVPLYDGSDLCPDNPPGGAHTPDCNTGHFRPIVGFLQLGITRTRDDDPGSSPLRHFEAVILNAVGCTPGATGNPVTGGGSAAIPVRLIHN